MMSSEAKRTVSLRAVLFTLVILLANAAGHGLIFRFFRDSTLNPLLTAVCAVLWGVLGVYFLFIRLTWRWSNIRNRSGGRCCRLSSSAQRSSC